jgi:hypothetical protein
LRVAGHPWAITMCTLLASNLRVSSSVASVAGGIVTVVYRDTYGEDAERHGVVLRVGSVGAAGAPVACTIPARTPNPASAIVRFAVIR